MSISELSKVVEEGSSLELEEVDNEAMMADDEPEPQGNEEDPIMEVSSSRSKVLKKRKRYKQGATKNGSSIRKEKKKRLKIEKKLMEKRRLRKIEKK